MSARFILTLFIPVLTSCVSYEREEASPQSVADTVAARTSGVLSIDAAIQLALDQNPELRALEARARGAAAATTVALPTQGEWRGRNEVVGIMLDPIALLGIGPRGAAISAAEAQHVEAMQALAVGRWRVIAAIRRGLRGMRIT